MYGFIKDVFLQIKKDTDTKYILLILLIGLAVYIPYILSFNSADSSCHYWTGDSWWYMNIVRSAVHDNDFDMANNIPENIHVIQGQLAMSSEGYLAPKHGIIFIPRIKNKLPEILLLLTVILLQIIFYSKYEYSLATEFGNRFLIITIALSSVFSANIIDLILNKFPRKHSGVSNR